MTDITDAQQNQIAALLDLKAQMTAELHPDLVPYLLTGPIGQMIKHPLINEICVIPGMHGHTNRLYEQRKQACATAWKLRDWPRFVFKHERPWRAEALEQCIHLGRLPLDSRTSWQLIKHVWTDSENVDENDDFWAGIWEHANAPMSMNKRERKAFEALPDPVPVWHGLERDDADELGFSWTTSEKVGIWFARRFGTMKSRKSYLASGFVPKAMVRAYILDRSEFEIIAFPEDVDGVKIRMETRPQGGRHP